MLKNRIITSFNLIAIILCFFYFIGHFRVASSIYLENQFIGSLLDDVFIFSIIFFFIVYLLINKLFKQELFSESTPAIFIIIFSLAIFQSIYLFFSISGEFKSVTFQSVYSFRKVFIPFLLFFVFSYLIRLELEKNGIDFYNKIIRVFKIFLSIAIAYNIIEVALRKFLPEFNTFYTSDYVYAKLLNNSAQIQIVDDYINETLRYVTGEQLKRSLGVNLNLYVSGHMIFMLYLFVCYMEKSFRVFSILNLLVFIALVLSGSRTFIVPYLLLNVCFIYFYVRKDKMTTIIALGFTLAAGNYFVIYLINLNFFYSSVLPVLILSDIYFLLVNIFFYIYENVNIKTILKFLFLVSTVYGLVAMTYFMLPTFGDGGYFVYLLATVEPILENWDIFIFGSGPVGFSPWGDIISWDGDLKYELHHKLSAIGFLEILYETGLYMSALFILLHVSVFSFSRFQLKSKSPYKMYIKNLKLIILINIFVGLLHWPILFDKSIIVFHVFFVALLYSSSKFNRDNLFLESKSCSTGNIILAS